MTSIQNDDPFKLPKITNSTPRVLNLSTTFSPSKADIQNQIKNIETELRTKLLNTEFKNQAFDEADAQNQNQNQKFLKLNNGKYIFMNASGKLIKKYGPFWPHCHRILHKTPKFIRDNLNYRELYNKQDDNKSTSLQFRIALVRLVFVKMLVNFFFFYYFLR